KFKFTADIRHLDLVQLNFLNNEYTSFSGLFNLDGTGNDMDNFIGKLSSSDVVICTIDSDFPIEHLEIQASRNIEERRIQMFSTVMDGLLVGEFDFEGLQYSMQSIIADVIPNLQGPEGKKKSTEKFDMYLTIRDFSLISELFVPALQITEGANLFLSMDDEQNDFSALFTADTLSYLDYHANEFLVDLQKPDSSLYLTLMADEFQFSDSLKLNLLSIDARNERDTIYTSIAWGHIDDNLKGDLNSRLIIAPDQQLTLDIEKAKFWIGIDDWQINEQASLTMKDKHITVDSLGIQHADQYLLIDGEIDTNPEAQLNVSLRDIDLSMFNPLLASSNLSISGLTNGDSQLRDLYESPLVAANLNTQRLTMNEYLLGDIDLESKWDNKQKLFDVEGELIKEERKILGFEGFYEPNDEISPLQLTASIYEAELAFLNAFIPEGISHIAGAISGDVKVSGHIDAPQLRGDIEFQKASVLVDYLNTTYYFEESASIHEDWFGLDGIHVYDQENNMAVLTGTIVHENFKDWNFDVFLDMEEENFLVLNTTAAQNEMYYGKAFVTGYAGVFGYSNNLEIDVNARSEAGTSLALPLGGSEDVAFGNFVTFVDFSNPDPEEKPLDLSGINLNLELDITPDAEMRIIFDEAVGDEIKGKGKGHINMVINNLSTFSMFGQVEVLEGNYLFTLKNLINKEFGVVKGGTISWYGDPLQAEVNIKAVYGLTAPLYDLMSENSEQYKQRVPVELIMDLSGNLLNPNIGFDIFLPTSNEITRTRVNSAISTEEEMNRQAFALLVLRRFISPPSISKEHNNIGIAENSTELLSSQLSNWLSQISNDFDIGVNYRPGDDISNEELAVALSTQLFNDRLRVSGNFGVAYSTAAQQST
ncbi:MAG: translocation/assembly module TamB domain-containing protein, partial [Flavobacteriales bacterium]